MRANRYGFEPVHKYHHFQSSEKVQSRKSTKFREYTRFFILWQAMLNKYQCYPSIHSYAAITLFRHFLPGLLRLLY